MNTITAAEKKISAFCSRRRLSYTWQPLKFNARRAVICTMDRIEHAATLDAARRLRGVKVSQWTAPASAGIFSGCVYLQDAADAERMQAAIDAETARSNAWWEANHAARLAGMDFSAAAAYAERLHPTPAQ